MYENHFLKNLLQWLLLARACCFVVMALGRCIARVQSKLQKKHLLQSKKLFFMNISSQGQQEKSLKKCRKQRFIQQEAHALYSGDLHFVSSALNIHRYHSWHCSFVCLQRAALRSSLQNNRPDDPSCIGDYAFRPPDSTDSAV